MSANKAPTVLVIIDGFGYREENQHNAVAAAKAPFFKACGITIQRP